MIGPQTLLPTGVRRSACACSTTCARASQDCDVVVMLRLQNERMSGALLPSAQEYFKHYGLTADKLALAQPRRDRHAPRADEPRRRDRFDRRRRPALGDPAAGDLRHRGAHGGDEHPGRQLMRLHIKNGRVVDPASGKDGTGELFVADGEDFRPERRKSRPRHRREGPGASRRASSTSRRGCASRATSTRRRSNRRWTPRSPAA